ncbi:hypothetical protein BCR43DRAFT_497090 [Syncephalastrum racemosum]|uniref:FYR N-terminal domain-containing protein n=1 Tax=Syncephalastrum racemosum TaxID=13706 RepID=A0A1X2H5D1_SYNRA|nr:hypothetical protein BCR43DRAFT_497090 [Syncephalastrum racemosum]
MTTERSLNDLKVSEYELKRQQMIAENQKLMEELGLANAALKSDTAMAAAMPAPPPRKKPRFQVNARPPADLFPSRASRRLKGEAPDDTVDLEELLDANDKLRQVEPVRQYIASKKSTFANPDSTYVPDALSVPFTLASIGTTIWDIGELKTGRGRSRYWSGRGCRYRHPYPVGFKATKAHFGNMYTMRIEEGANPEDGPIFTVQVNQTDTIFKGYTPTAPWTEACKKSRSQGTRVSGPLFYGFSDLITMRLIENMDNYKEAFSPEEPEEEEEEGKTEA